MTQKKDDKYYIVKIIESCEEIIKYTNTKSKEEFLLNVPIQGMTCFMFIQISENAKFLSNDFINKHNEISWDQIRGLRNRVVHD